MIWPSFEVVGILDMGGIVLLSVKMSRCLESGSFADMGHSLIMYVNLNTIIYYISLRIT
jgi:hypothetical protein